MNAQPPATTSVSELWTATQAAVSARFNDHLIVAAAFSFLPNLLILRLLGSGFGASLLATMVGLVGQLAIIGLVLNRQASVGEALQRAVQVFLPALGTLAVSVFAAIIGFLALIIPGLYLVARLYIALPTIVDTGGGVEAALRSSWEKTGPSAWKLAGVLAVMFLALFIAAIIAASVGLAVSGTPEEPDFVSTLLTSAIGTIFAIYFSVFQGVAYQKLSGAPHAPATPS